MHSELKKKVRDTGVKGVRVQKSGCLDYCENGISCVIYPMSEWYSLEGEKDLEILFERIPAKITATAAVAAVKYNSQPIINSLNQITISIT